MRSEQACNEPPRVLNVPSSTAGLPEYITFIFRQQTHKVGIWPDITSRDIIQVMKLPKRVVSAELRGGICEPLPAST